MPRNRSRSRSRSRYLSSSVGRGPSVHTTLSGLSADAASLEPSAQATASLFDSLDATLGRFSMLADEVERNHGTASRSLWSHADAVAQELREQEREEAERKKAEEEEEEEDARRTNAAKEGQGLNEEEMKEAEANEDARRERMRRSSSRHSRGKSATRQ